MIIIPAGSIIRTKQRPSATLPLFLAPSLTAATNWITIQTETEDYVGKATGRVVEVANPYDAKIKEFMIEILRPETSALNTSLASFFGPAYVPSFQAKTYWLNVWNKAAFDDEYYISEKKQTVIPTGSTTTGGTTTGGTTTGTGTSTTPRPKVEVFEDGETPGGVVVVTKPDGSKIATTPDGLNSPPKWPTYALLGVFALAAFAILYSVLRKPKPATR